MVKLVIKFALTSSILICCSTGSTSSSADPPPSKDSLRIVLTKGKRAPFSGILLTHVAIATILGELEERAKALQIELDAVKETAKLKEASLAEMFATTLEEERAKRTAVERDLARRVEAYENLLKRCDASLPPWYRSNWFTFAAGAVLSGGACAAVSITR